MFARISHAYLTPQTHLNSGIFKGEKISLDMVVHDLGIPEVETGELVQSQSGLHSKPLTLKYKKNILWNGP